MSPWSLRVPLVPSPGRGGQAEPCPELPRPIPHQRLFPDTLPPPPRCGDPGSRRQVNGTREGVTGTGGCGAAHCALQCRAVSARRRHCAGERGGAERGGAKPRPDQRSRDGAAPEASKAPPGRRGAPLRRAHAQRREGGRRERVPVRALPGPGQLLPGELASTRRGRGAALGPARSRARTGAPLVPAPGEEPVQPRGGEDVPAPACAASSLFAVPAPLQLLLVPVVLQLQLVVLVPLSLALGQIVNQSLSQAAYEYDT
ncbi:hypothetical protein Q9966_000585 [Columba livia]|nr:hypothetical protein Q9966_000585 [Columba livia]